MKWFGLILGCLLILIILLAPHTTPLRKIGSIESRLPAASVTLPSQVEVELMLYSQRAAAAMEMLTGKKERQLWWEYLSPDTLVLGLQVEGERKCHMRLMAGRDIVAQGIVSKGGSFPITLSLERPELLHTGINHFTLLAEGTDGQQVTFTSRERKSRVAAGVFVSEHFTGFQAIKRWYHFSGWQSALFCAVCLCLCLGSFIERIKKGWLYILAGAYLAGHTFLTPALSGHDETAHIDMFYRALHGVVRCTGAADCPHFKEIGQHMIENGFYNLHRVAVIPVDEQPHHILTKIDSANTGVTPGPMNWYGFVTRLYSLLGGEYHDSPETVVFFVRSFNFLAFFLLLVACGYGASYGATLAMSLVIILNGSLLGQIGSITNDIPYYWAGSLLGFVLVRQISRKKLSWKTLIAVAFVLSSLPLLRRVDYSWIAFGPGLLFTGIVLLARFSKKTFHYFFPILTIICILFAVVLFMDTGINKQLSEVLQPLLPKYKHILALGNIGIHDFIQIIGGHIVSWFGSYVWGHSSYPLPLLYCLSLICLLYLVVGGLATKRDLNWYNDRFIFDGYFASLICYIVLVLAISAPYVGTQSLWVHNKLRFTAASSFLLSIPFSYVTIRLTNNYTGSTQVIYRVLFGVLSLLFGVNMLQIYFVDMI